MTKAVVLAVRVRTVTEQAAYNRRLLESANRERAALSRKYGKEYVQAFNEASKGNYALMDTLYASAPRKLEKAFAELELNQAKLDEALGRNARKLQERVRTSFVTNKGIEGTVNSVSSDKEGDTIGVKVFRKEGKRAIVAIRQ